MRTRLLTMLLIWPAACSSAKPMAPEPAFQQFGCEDRAPLIQPDVSPSDLIADHYIVAYKPEVTSPEERTGRLALKYGFTTTSRWDGELMKGFAASLSSELVDALRCESAVASITQQYVIRVP